MKQKVRFYLLHFKKQHTHGCLTKQTFPVMILQHHNKLRCTCVMTFDKLDPLTNQFLKPTLNYIVSCMFFQLISVRPLGFFITTWWFITMFSLDNNENIRFKVITNLKYQTRMPHKINISSAINSVKCCLHNHMLSHIYCANCLNFNFIML